jgi:cobalt/nickel transport system permease protein
MAGSLMIRSFERSERIYSAMLARGYQGQLQVLTQPQLQRRDRLALAIAILLFAIVLTSAYL